MKKYIIALVVMVLTLSACSNDEKKKPVTIKDKLTKDKQIAYVYDTKNKNIKKSDKVQQILSIDDGKAKPYMIENASLTLEELTKKDDEEVLKIAKKADKKAFESEKESQLESEKLLSVIKKDKKKKADKKDRVTEIENVEYSKPKAIQLKFSAPIKDSKDSKEIVLTPSPYNPYASMKLERNKDYERTNKSFPMIFSDELESVKINGERYSGLQDDVGDKNRNVVVHLKDDESKITFDKAE